MATALTEFAKSEGSPMEQRYRNTIYCCSSLLQEGGRITSTQYCGNRWCLGCTRIRTALAIGRYLPVLLTWPDPQLVTTTIRNVSAIDLPDTVKEMCRAVNSARRQMRRVDNLPLIALRKLEITYNPTTREYHPHFHWIVRDRQTGERLVTRWMEYFPDLTDPKGQDIRRVDDRNALLELFKYFTKFVTKSQMMPTHALDVIFRAMVGRRVFQPMGFKLPKVDEEGELELDRGTAAVSRPDAEITWAWSQADTDWIDPKTGEHLTGYVPGDRFKALVESIDPGGKQDELSIIQALARCLPEIR